MGDWFRGLSWRQEFDCGRSAFACFLRRVADGERCEQGDPGWRRRGLGRRTRQSTPILERVVSHVTITDPHHFLFGHRLEVLKERSGRGPAYVVVALPDGRRRGVGSRRRILPRRRSLSARTRPTCRASVYG